MSMTVSNLAAYNYSAYSFENSDTYSTYAVDSSEVSEEYYNISSVPDAISELEEATDSTNLYSIGRVDSFVKSQYDFSQLGIYDSLKETLDSYDVASVLTNDTDLSEMYALANTANQVSESYLTSLLESSGYTQSAVSSYSSYLEDESSTSGLLDVTV
jgi:hypothetical protein